jgi:hypothetical protein
MNIFFILIITLLSFITNGYTEEISKSFFYSSKNKQTNKLTFEIKKGKLEAINYINQKSKLKSDPFCNDINVNDCVDYLRSYNCDSTVTIRGVSPKIYCPSSCETCVCSDTQTKCIEWSLLGYCNLQSATGEFLSRYCRLSCAICKLTATTTASPITTTILSSNGTTNDTLTNSAGLHLISKNFFIFYTLIVTFYSILKF